MAEPKTWVTFVDDCEMRDANGVVVDSFEKGKAYELRPDQAARWVRRFKAVEGKGAEAAAQILPEPEDAPTEPKLPKQPTKK